MFFKVRDLHIRPGKFDVELAPGELEFLDPKLRQTGPLKATGVVEMVSEHLAEIRVKGHLTVRMEADCDRCLDPAPHLIDSDFELYYRPVEEGYGEEVELDEGEAEMGFYEGEGIELNDCLREFVLLALPMQRICSEECKGICPVCGQNRNLKDCDCQTTPVDGRWEALKNLGDQESGN